ncbi:hypothetical protein OPV22_006327 [Ensete ventricosum]|uniref:Uncharacterized protein n=1 Tax=Ensete ventricosum TaxID=4639 RepID=A0AAV8RRH9_ENSVE|nr:hypothetical protein OPV22_006327 [Ensete ventricosum]
MSLSELLEIVVLFRDLLSLFTCNINTVVKKTVFKIVDAYILMMNQSRIHQEICSTIHGPIALLCVSGKQSSSIYFSFGSRNEIEQYIGVAAG